LAHDQLTYDDLLRIVELIRSSEQFSEFRLKVGEIEIELRRRPEAGALASAAPSPAPATPAASVPSTPSAVASSAIAVDAGTRAAAVAPAWPPGSIVVRAPMVGTFYRSPEPGAPPFVEVGQAVEPDTTVCIIEVMKLMNSIPAGARGVVAQIIVENGAPVETRAPLIVIDPSRAPQ
jgi:acetyl-CoA carboxylase biotin carboxyl carrier protein